MDKLAFYAGKQVTLVEWWLHDCDLPSLTWARVRTFSDSTADACWAAGTTLYGFSTATFAGHFLAEDEYVRFSDADALDLGNEPDTIAPPVWVDSPDQPFEYLGTY